MFMVLFYLLGLFSDDNDPCLLICLYRSNLINVKTGEPIKLKKGKRRDGDV